MPKPRSVRWRIGAIILLIVGLSLFAHFFGAPLASSGIAMKLIAHQICISNSVPGGGRDVTCWKIDSDTKIRPANLNQGDSVTVHYRDHHAEEIVGASEPQ